MKYLIYLVIASVCLELMASGAPVIGTTDDSMSIGGGARPIGMGRAHTAVVEDADAPFINPAGLASLKGPEAMAMYTNLLGEVYYQEFSGAVPTPYGTFGLGYINTGVNNIVVPDTPVPTDYYDSLLSFTYATPLANYFQYGRNVFVGANYKIYNRGYTGGHSELGQATGFSGDIGVKLAVNQYLSFGLCRQNFIPVSMGSVIRLSSGAEESLASITKIGTAIKPVPLPKLLIAADADLPAQTGRPLTAHFGCEWKENQYLTFRAGLDQSVDPATATLTSWNPAIGTSLTYGGMRVDFAYHAYYNDPGLATSYVSLSYIGQPWFALKGKVE